MSGLLVGGRRYDNMMEMRWCLYWLTISSSISEDSVASPSYSQSEYRIPVPTPCQSDVQHTVFVRGNNYSHNIEWLLLMSSLRPIIRKAGSIVQLTVLPPHVAEYDLITKAIVSIWMGITSYPYQGWIEWECLVWLFAVKDVCYVHWNVWMVNI